MKSILNMKALAVLVVLFTSVSAECDGHVHNRHARAAKAHRRQVIPRVHTETTVDLTVTTTTASIPDAVKRDTPSTSSAAPEVHTDTGATAALAEFKAPSIPFPDGTYDCTDFPADQQGVLSLDYLGLGGWSGIQYPGTGGTGVSGMTCTEGAYCSYACQPGMSKTQWPTVQPSDGETRGGLTCTNGKLYLTNSASPYLCEWGQQASYVVNTLASDVAICQTDYPGTENMVVPTVVSGNQTLPLNCPDEDSYFKWEGKLTSAQYYVNPSGGSASSQCVWGAASGDIGNWAPVNFGSGYTGGVAWLSIMYNPLQTASTLDYNVKIECASGTMNGECVYENGVIQQGGTGCTVSCDGVCHFVLY